uniref:Uncharacterized protein n=1 Tax=Oryza rufipogon TaxID=4529 RepID=A0A0E0NB08_ORYRU
MLGHPAQFDLAAGHPLTHPAVSEPYPDLAGNQSKRRTPPITPTTRTPARKNSEESSTQWITGIAEVCWRGTMLKQRQGKLHLKDCHSLQRLIGGSWEMKLCALAALAAATTSSAVASSFPNRMFSLMLVANSAGSWLTSPICARSHFSRSLRMSTPSTITSPADGS